MPPDHEQNKPAELAFFPDHAEVDEYNVSTEQATQKLFKRYFQLTHLKSGSIVADIGCGSGVFTQLLHESSVNAIGLDLSYPLLLLGRRKYPGTAFVLGDAEILPFSDSMLDGVMLSAVLHHLPDPSRRAREVFRVLKPGGAFVALDPNGRNPFMYLYRDHSSPFYSSIGVTANERPVIPERVAEVFAGAGFQIAASDYM